MFFNIKVMVKRINLVTLGVLLLMVLSSSSSCKSSKYTADRYAVELNTSSGKLVVELYNETPLHRDNFIKLVNEKYYDGILFHRVIKEFMIQTGDPETKNYDPSKTYGSGGPDYTIPAEFVPTLFHQKGALAAARLGDQQNPKRESSGSQFYIVQGKVYNPDEMVKLEEAMAHQTKMAHAQGIVQRYFNENQVELRKLTEEQFNAKIDSVGSAAYDSAPGYSFTEQQRAVYSSVGGTPFLDSQYTVFGIVVVGLEIVDSIAAVDTSENDAPKNPVKIISAKIVHTPKGAK